MARTSMTYLAFDGSAAVALERPARSLTLLEGGRGRRGAACARRLERGRLTTSQLVAVFAVIACFVGILATASFVSDALSARATADALAAAPVETVVVSPGETLWGIAEAHRPAGVATSDVVDWAIERNDLGSGVVFAGQRLVMPRC